MVECLRYRSNNRRSKVRITATLSLGPSTQILVGKMTRRQTLVLLPKIMELVGLGYTGWFVYRYLLFKGKIFDVLATRIIFYVLNSSTKQESNRKELAEDIEQLKKKIAGTE
ncbi:Protein CURVATURE THYLAKOID 1A, chloroplastic [Datura stramonium]|uniref:Protein CURVATURE THYLAKOID 1A, chloroplastic n=1 Tax=Datura stramonium TaxID=4076 RepID=A0ABS8SNT3_DATST|nr:Protein CURVATURE THYLAKOID 1A, chloroplastic [Datura stramonium]